MMADGAREHRLKLCVLGVSSSIHVQRRSVCFVRRGHEVTVVSPVPHEIAGVRNICIPSAWGAKKAQIPLYVLRLMRAIWKLRPDIVHVHYAGVYELLACYLAGRPYVVTMIGSDILKKLDGTMGGLKKRVMVFCLKRASLLNSVSDEITNVVRKHIGTDKRIIKVAWGIDLDIFRPLDKLQSKQRFGIDDNKFVILSPRLMKPLYNIDTIIRAVALLPHEINYLLILCSYNADSEYKNYLLNLVREHQIEGEVKVLGVIDNETMPYIYSAADVSIMIPDSDGMPISLLEAMACGVPNILSNLPNYDEIVEDNVSATYAEIKPEAVAAQIMRIYENDNFALSIIENAQKRIRQLQSFNDDVVAIEQEYYRIVQGHRKEAMNASL